MKMIEERQLLRSITPIDMGEKPKRAKGVKRDKPWNLRPTKELQELMEAALAATGADRTDLILQCIKEELPSVVNKLLEQRRQAEKKFRDLDVSKQQKQGKGE